MPNAVTGHLAWRASENSHFVGPFICSSPRWRELVECLPADASVTVSVTVPSAVTALESAVTAALDEPRTRLTSVEVPVPEQNSLDGALRALDAVLPADVTGFVELPWNAVDDAVCARLAGSRHRLKIRTGGVTRDSFPSEEVLASLIGHAVRRRVPFKLTAGLHQAVRHRDPVTGFEHHGFLNVIAAATAALDGAEARTVCSLLATQDNERLVEVMRDLDAGTALAVRQQFLSFGTCSIDEPLDDLQTLRLLEEPHA